MNVAMAQVGPPIRSLWINVARALQSDGHQVYFFGPSPAFQALLRREGHADHVCLFDECGRMEIPEVERASDILRYNERELGRPPERLQQVAFNYRQKFDECEIDVAVFWNDIDVGRLVAEANGVETVYLENGYLGDSIQIDPEGVNCNASFASLGYHDVLEVTPLWEPTHGLSRPVNPIEPLSLGSKVRALFKTRGAHGNFWWTIEQELGRQVTSLRRRLMREAESNATVPNNHLLIVFQVHDDTQILFNSPYIDDMYELMELVTDAVAEIDDRPPIVVKEHPADIGRIDYSDLQSHHTDVIWLRKYSLDDLLEKARIVITINSSVGMQALDKNIPVVTLGESFYDGNPFVEHPTEPEEVAPALRMALNRSIDEQAAGEYLDAFQKRLFIEGGLGSLRPTTIECICSTILNVGAQRSTSLRSS